MKERIEEKLGCSIEECYIREMDYLRGGSSAPCSLWQLTNEEYEYMMAEIMKNHGADQIEL